MNRESNDLPIVVRDVVALRDAIASATGSLLPESVGTESAKSALHRPDVGFVPTMGALHAGHQRLVARSRAENAVTVVSIFVNPAQFNNADDLARYPRDEAGDVVLLGEAGADIVFAPTPEVMYPGGFSTWVNVEGISDLWEGEFRPGHFRGVATVVTRLLRAVRPVRAYFGEKDWQQLLVVRALERDLMLDVEIIAVATVRESDGLAMSSRNLRLDSDARRSALAISAAIRVVQRLFAEGVEQASELESALHSTLAAEPLLEVEYAVIVDAETLRTLTRIDRPARVLIAASAGGVRLIDNGALG